MIEKVQTFWNWYQDSGLADMPVEVPLVETLLVFAMLTVCLLFRFSRIGLILGYVFVYRWAWSARAQLHLEDPAHYTMFTTAYIIFGILVLAFSVIGMIRPRE